MAEEEAIIFSPQQGSSTITTISSVSHDAATEDDSSARHPLKRVKIVDKGSLIEFQTNRKKSSAWNHFKIYEKDRHTYSSLQPLWHRYSSRRTNVDGSSSATSGY